MDTRRLATKTATSLLPIPVYPPALADTRDGTAHALVTVLRVYARKHDENRKGYRWQVIGGRSVQARALRGQGCTSRARSGTKQIYVGLYTALHQKHATSTVEGKRGYRDTVAGTLFRREITRTVYIPTSRSLVAPVFSVRKMEPTPQPSNFHPHEISCESRKFKLLSCPSATETYLQHSLTSRPAHTPAKFPPLPAGYLAQGGLVNLESRNNVITVFSTQGRNKSENFSDDYTVIGPCRSRKGLRWCRARRYLVMPCIGKV